jgi:PPOX class probable F420-dependent enzyme
LATERIIWLTTVSPSGVPHPRPVWFLWDGETFLIYSQPDTFKLEHIAAKPNVALNLDGDGLGGNIVVFTGQIRLDLTAPPAYQVLEYVTKYQPGFERINMTAEGFAAAYSVPLRVTPTRLRGH